MRAAGAHCCLSLFITHPCLRLCWRRRCCFSFLNSVSIRAVDMHVQVIALRMRRTSTWPTQLYGGTRCTGVRCQRVSSVPHKNLQQDHQFLSPVLVPYSITTNKKLSQASFSTVSTRDWQHGQRYAIYFDQPAAQAGHAERERDWHMLVECTCVRTT